ncbi:MAG: stage IV sporulation protein A [Lachnospiraceae bacterium]|nr:stage IV sporulation protein A [Lachnospiraceae bacterium]
MGTYDLYADMKARTNGEVYIGVVGPVRTGKSTFIKRFMNLMVLPNIEEEPVKVRARDELPMSSAGKTVTTTEPKFIPQEAVNVKINDAVDMKVRMIDCVGFMIPGAVGHEENGEERMVKTPWFDYEIPFTKAAEIGTRKVIHDHSTIGMVVTTDGSFGELPRDAYIEAEQRTIQEIRGLGKPFVLLLNSARPYANETMELAKQLEESYGVRVLPMNADQLRKEDITEILQALLLEFPVAEVDFHIPKWAEALNLESEVKTALISMAKEILNQIQVVRDVYHLEFPESQYIEKVKLDSIALDSGKINLMIHVDDAYYYQMLSDMLGVTLENEYQFMKVLKELAEKRKEYEQVADALESVKFKGYGCVTPAQSDIHIEKPEVIKHGNKYGVKIKAEAPSIHMIKANITTEIAPIVGAEDQAKDLVEYIGAEGQEDIWSVNIFGKTIEQLVEDGIRTKTGKITDESQVKLQDTMEKIVNDGNGGMVCIII